MSDTVPETTQAAPPPERAVAPAPQPLDPAKRREEATADPIRPPGYDDTDIRHPAVQAVALPTSSRPAPGPGPGPLPTIIESATPQLAKAQANLEADYEAGAASPAEANARARAAAGHRAADTVDLPEAAIRAADNAAALDELR